MVLDKEQNSMAHSFAPSISKMLDIKIINRAKWALINSLNMSEDEAHRYIEKQAMDKCISKRNIADEILKTYK